MTDAPDPAVAVHRSSTITLLVLAAVCLSLAIALGAPIATAVIGLILFGILHNLLEIRYVAGRFSGLLGRPFLELLAALVTGIVVCRLLAGVVGRPAQLAEIVLGYVILAAAARHGLDGRRRVAAWVLIGAAAAVSLTFPTYHFVVLTHLHNVVPLFFLWEWSRRITSRRGRQAFRAVQLLWVVAIPAVVLLGFLDGSLSADPGIVRSVVGDGQTVLAASAPPSATATVLGMRFLTVFAFMQTMHYVVWVALLPRVAPDASAAFEARVPWMTGPRLWAMGFLAASLFAVLFGLDFAQGKTLYAALASYHAYLELPVLLALLVGARSLSTATRASDRDGSGTGSTPSTPASPTPLPPAGGGSRGAELRPEATAAVAPDTEVAS
ncbi:hypothetical protein [Terracoccus sp. 273MFTsu3.1]|uniref:hypothetical protein n=1 Tax=Terracoccus sp. 273MFTsu3.1 TaxID=1172188 RepID=UPI000377CBCD|nr:hypothetical protein [Terracoccus sp. 273MFTsu3.1]